MMIVGILEIPQLNLLAAQRVLVWVFMALSPHFCLGQALRQLGNNYLSLSTCKPLIAADYCASSAMSTEACCPG